MNFIKWLNLKHLFPYSIISIVVYSILVTQCFVFYGMAGIPRSTCSFLPDNIIAFLIESPWLYWIFSFLISLPLYILLLRIVKKNNTKFLINGFSKSIDSFKSFGENIAGIVNISLALFFCLWQLLLALCFDFSGPGLGGSLASRCYFIPFGLRDDLIVIMTFYLIILLATIFFFLIASEKNAKFIKSLGIFFLTMNIIFIAFLFFEI